MTTKQSAIQIPENGAIILYTTDDGASQVALYSIDGRVWLNQNQIADLFATSKQNVSFHILNILEENELQESSVVKDFLTTAQDGKTYSVRYYALEMILAVGFRVRGIRGTQFRQWALKNLSEYLVKGFVMDDARLKRPDGRPDYFDELLARIRDIRASELRFYQKVRALFSLSSDYDKTDKATQMFFAETQNKLLYAVTQKTAAEIVVERADPAATNMGLTSWSGQIVRKGDVVIAKNYLSEQEVDLLNRLVTVFLETAEIQVRGGRDLTIAFWRGIVDQLLNLQGKPVLQGNGTVTKAEMERLVKERYDTFNLRRKHLALQRADAEDLEELKQLEQDLKRRHQTG